MANEAPKMIASFARNRLSARLLSVGLRDRGTQNIRMYSDHRNPEAIHVRLKIVARMIFAEHVPCILPQPVASVTPYLQ